MSAVVEQAVLARVGALAEEWGDSPDRVKYLLEDARISPNKDGRETFCPVIAGVGVGFYTCQV